MVSDKDQQETPAQRAMSEIGRAKLQNWKETWFPLQQRAGAEAIKSMDPGSFDTQHATGMATTDTAARFAQVPQAITQAAGARGGFGGAAHKLALAGAGSDAATSIATGATEAQQDVQDAAVGNMGSLVRMASGQEANAVNGLARSADISGRRAAADAESALARRLGNAQLAGTVAGAGLGAYAGMDPSATQNTVDYRGTILPNELRGGA